MAEREAKVGEKFRIGNRNYYIGIRTADGYMLFDRYLNFLGRHRIDKVLLEVKEETRS